jgi:hypothetical protein
MSEQIADFGVQSDRAGDIWNCNLAASGVSDRGSYRSIAFVKVKEPVRTTSEEVIFRELFTVVNVQKESNLITDSSLVESLTRHRLLSDGNIETAMSVKVYNAGGLPRQLQENIASERLIQPWSPLDVYKGKNMKESFANFLKDRGLEDLVPE